MINTRVVYTREPPLCRAFLHACSRSIEWFEFALWTEWLLLLTFWIVIFCLFVHCGARNPPRNSACIVDRYCCAELKSRKSINV